MYVYQIINSLNNKSYIGITNNIKTRFEVYKGECNREKFNKENEREIPRSF